LEDRDVLHRRRAQRRYYVSSTLSSSWRGEPELVVGRRAPEPGTTRLGAFGKVNPPLAIHRREIDVLLDDSSRLFAVEEVIGLEARSFKGNWPDTGFAESYLVAEELPVALAYGPQAAVAIDIVSRLERLTAAQIKSLGQTARRVPPRPPEVIQRLRAGPHSAADVLARRIDRAVERCAVDAGVEPNVWDWFRGCAADEVHVLDPDWQQARDKAREAVSAALVGCHSIARVFVQAMEDAEG
jgi:hypothetical protein